jgi:hypothetical protein
VAAEPGRYRKIFPRLWRSADFVRLSERERLITLYILCGPQTNRIGYTYFSAATAAEDLQLAPAAFQRWFLHVCTTLGWKFDRTNRVLWLPSWWRFNTPENGNVLKGCLRDLADVPVSPLLAEFGRHTETLPETLRETFTQTFWERIGERLPIQEQEQEQ